MKDKPKFNKRKCMKCKYHAFSTDGYRAVTKRGSRGVVCNYATITGITCLKPDGIYKLQT